MLHLDNPLSAPTLCLTPFQRGDNYPDTGGYRRDKEIANQIIGTRRHIDIPITVLTPEGKKRVTDYETYANLVLSIPLPECHDRFRLCFGTARKLLVIAWTEIASGQDMAHAIELGRFSAFTALDATIGKHKDYKNKPMTIWNDNGALKQGSSSSANVQKKMLC